MKHLLARTQEWFDVELDRAELAIGTDDTVFARAGAGDHVLCLLGAAPRVVLVAGAPTEMALLELKLAGVKSLAHGEWLEFLGAKETHHRPELYQRLRWLLSTDADAFWQEHFGLIERGLCAQGELERGLASFRRFAAFAVGTARVASFLELEDRGAQAEALERDFRGFLWRKFADRVIGAAWPGMTRLRLEAAMTATPAKASAGLNWLLAGRFGPARPFHLREEPFNALKSVANRVILMAGPAESALATLPEASVDAFAMGAGGMSDALVTGVLKTGRSGARLTVRGGALPGEFIERRGRGVDGGLWPDRLVAATLVGEDIVQQS